MRKESSRPKERESAKNGFAGRELLADLASDDQTGQFSIKQLRKAVVDSALEGTLSGEAVKDVLAALPRPRSR